VLLLAPAQHGLVIALLDLPLAMPWCYDNALRRCRNTLGAHRQNPQICKPARFSSATNQRVLPGKRALRRSRTGWSSSCGAFLDSLVCRLLDTGESMGEAVRLMLIGHFFSQTLPSGVGGDAVRF